ncbi:DUF1653 domain-containing protein [Kangiella sp. HZ709]|uniref:DUF1653 domain-containing protein n=1 Tax=Kangiella sp. HZ709 TaxID=2666328 RepID=UPI0012AF3755|nr:DUF1653 domain-containing protein [Kangiella sp. HZ709]MRX27562.1 DUF1653 domain-containing protein [Kangiella sp. HZ709]
MTNKIKKGIYQHFKGQKYEVLDVATHSETGEQYVVYKALYGDFGTWIRPLDMFTETIERNEEFMSRFKFVK